MKRRDARVLVIGAGGLGSSALRVLARASVGTIGIVDDDRVEVSNLHRQILHRTVDAGRSKVESARDAILSLDDTIAVHVHAERFVVDRARALVADYDLVVDGSDNFATKFLVNDVCVRSQIPFVHGGAIGWRGQLLAVAVGAPCYRCLFEAPPPAALGASCREAGVVGPVVGVVGALQAEAALALLDGKIATALSTLWIYDGLSGTTRSVRFAKNPHCAACGDEQRAIATTQYEVATC